LDRIDWVRHKEHGDFLILVSHFSASGATSKQTMGSISLQLPQEYDQYFKATAQGSWFINEISRSENLIRMASSWWLLSESGDKAALINGNVIGSSNRLDRGKLMNHIIVMLPEPKYSGSSDFTCNIRDLSAHCVLMADRPPWSTMSTFINVPGTHFITISDILRLKINQVHLPLQRLAVFRLTNVHVLHISFCKVQAECSRCFNRYARFSDANENQHDQSSDLSKSVSCRLQCGTKFTSINWQCSCIIDDGTGIAQLYADKDICLKLIAKGVDVSLIEDCSWQEPFIYYNSSPINPYLRDALNESHARMRTQIFERGRNILDDWSKRARAEYEFYRLCRYSNKTMVTMDFFCRPIESSLFRSMDSIKFIAAVHGGYNVPREHESFCFKPLLKLKLIDCFTSGKSARIIRDEIRALSHGNSFLTTT
jgi:hypothetical protein